jgi:hypothetical protein
MKRRISILAAMVVACVLASLLFTEFASRRRSAAFTELALRLESGLRDSQHVASINGLIKDLLDSEWGCERLAELDARHDGFAYDSKRAMAYYVAADARPGATRKYGIHSVGIGMSGHCGFPHQFQLQSVHCENDHLVLELETLGDAQSRAVLQELWKIEGGRRYEATIDLASTRGGYAAMSDIREYRPL